jgi:hypothetical protein
VNRLDEQQRYVLAAACPGATLGEAVWGYYDTVPESK